MNAVGSKVLSQIKIFIGYDVMTSGICLRMEFQEQEEFI